MKQSEESMYFIYKKQIANEIVRLRGTLGITVQALANKLGLTFSAVWQWENGKSSPSREMTQKLEELGAKFTEEQKNILITVLRNSGLRSKKAPLTWEEQFNKKFTRVNHPDNAPGYDGDDWQFRGSEPVKPSMIKEFIKEIMNKENEK
jgi:transcriptional regulator with XRE-family HTH domain